MDQKRAVRRDRQQQKDSAQTVETLLADLDKATLSDFGDDHSAALVQWLSSRQSRLVTDDHWKLTDDHESAAGEKSGRPRVKLTNVNELLRICHG
jgi:ferredoxin--NADP+ reductase